MLTHLRSRLFVGIASLATGLCFAAAGCSDINPSDVTDTYGPGFSFEKTGNTYAWAPESEKTTGEGRPKSPEVDRLIRKLLEQGLAKKGYVPAGGAAPHLWIDYRVAREMRGDPYVFGGFPQYAEGSLLVYVINPNTRQPAWRGCVEARLDESAPPEQRAKKLELAIKLLLDRIPNPKK